MAQDEIPELLRDMLYAGEHRLLEDDVGRAIQRIVGAGVTDTFVHGQLKDRVAKHKIAQYFQGPFPLPHLRVGELLQGFDLRGRPVWIPIQYLESHVLTEAGSGSGKTNRVLFHAAQIIGRVQGCWLVDCRKREFAKLQPFLKKRGLTLILLPARALQINPLQVPLGVHPADWIPRLADVLVMVLDAPPRASKLLESLLHRLFGKMRVFHGSDLYPTLFDLFLAIRDDRAANPQARLALLDGLEPVLADLGPEVLAYRRGWPIHELARLPINFVFGGVSNTAQNLLLNSLILSEFASRVARGVSNPAMDLFVCVDEAQGLISTSRSYRHALFDLWPLVRGTGMGLDVSVPTSQGLRPEALSYTATKYLGRCGSAADYETVGRAMGLNKAQLDWVFHNTRPGRFVAQLGEGDWRRPYVIDFPLLPEPGCATDPGDDPHDGFGHVPRLPIVRA